VEHGQPRRRRCAGHVRLPRQNLDAGAPVTYAYHGKIYQLRATKTEKRSHAIASQFEIKNIVNGELTRFSMTYGTAGALAEVPLTVTFQPKWWLEVEIVLDDSTPGPAISTENRP